MFICNDCGAMYDSLEKFHEYIDDDGHEYNIYYGCPNCRSDNVDQLCKCDLCGEYVADGYVLLKDGTIACNNCYTLY